jgi:hypothetical protein
MIHIHVFLLKTRKKDKPIKTFFKNSQINIEKHPPAYIPFKYFFNIKV